MVQVWDLRSLKSPLHTLKGHSDDAVVVRWAPFQDGVLASCSSDSHLHIWNLTPEEQNNAEEGEQAEEETPELLFAHGGHTEGVSDFSWSEVDNFLLCSVAEDNKLQIWQPSTACYLEDSDGEAVQEPPSKRVRADGSND